MPEATVNEDHAAAAGEDEVGAAVQPTAMQSEAEAHAMHESPHEAFRSGVLGSHRGHDPGAFGRGEDVRHHRPAYQIAINSGRGTYLLESSVTTPPIIFTTRSVA
jgi:hypothetical protein